ncbi:YdaS family helix-turn-helix protein [Neisseriaceae bacterium ESL0693]|nr:YdaS family helix-turn-helix protein [Neisseriaceae bacterium ESL0693]
MNLYMYFKSKPRGERLVLAKKIGCNPTYLSHCSKGIRVPSPKLSVAIEKATEGEVTRYDLRKDAKSIWG